jgi:hydroxyacylglutathione hydrolase
MILQRFYDDNLAQASYLLGCEKSKRAVIVDPTIEVERYLTAAADRKLTITNILETHVHADYVSGGAALAAENGAELGLSAEGDPQWGYDFDSARTARKLRDGDEISLGSVSIRVLHTPGHTPEHLTFLVSDASRGSAPVGAFTGDFIFVGDVGRPDLLERAAGAEGTMRDSARTLYKSIRAFIASQPDHLQLWPGHGAGSACGKALGSMPSSTLGYEKLFNWALSDRTEEDFIREVLKDQPPVPRYFAEMKKRNRLAVPAEMPGEAAELSFDAIATGVRGGATVIDTRAADAFAAGHIPGTINIPFNKSFLNWSGSLVDGKADLLLIAGNADDAMRIVADLAKIGLTRVRGWLPSPAIAEWTKTGQKLETIRQIGVSDLHDSPDDTPIVVDVRAPYEWSEGHIPGATHIPLAELPERAAELAAAGKPIAVHCKGGGRSSIAASILRAKGVPAVSNVSGGFDGWKNAGFPVAKG